MARPQIALSAAKQLIDSGQATAEEIASTFDLRVDEPAVQTSAPTPKLRRTEPQPAAKPTASLRPGSRGSVRGFLEGTKDIAASHALNAGGGLVEGVVGAAGLAIDTTIDALSAGPVRRFAKGLKTGTFEQPPNRLTRLTSRAIDDAIQTGKDVLDVKSDTKEMDMLSRFAGNVIAPGPELLGSAKAAPAVAPRIAKPVAAPTPTTPAEKVTQALREAKPLRRQQETLYTKARAEKITESIAARTGTTGEKGFHAELGALKGEMPKVQFESLRAKIGQDDIDGLFDTVRDTEKLSDWEKITARKGLAKLFGEYGGHVPQEGEIALLNKVFGKDFTKAVLDKRPMLQKFKELSLELANVPRAIMSSFDLSAPFRQGVFFVGRPKQFFPAFKDMYKSLGSEKAYQALEDSIQKRPTYGLMKESGLSLTDLEAVATREEKFASNLAERIPLIGHGVRASGRAYTGFLTKLRADVFDDLVTKAKALGLDPEQDRDLAKAVAKFVNAGTGRGDLPESLAGSANLLNAFFFSPKLASSRITLLNPMYYVKQPAFVRKEALKSMLTFVGFGATLLSMAKLAGAEVSLDPRGSDFGKIRIGDTRVDVWGGFQQYVRMASQLASGKYISATSGKEYTLGEGYKPTTRYDILLRQIESKEAPLASLATTILRQQDYAGEPVDVPKEIAERFTPMVAADMIELAKEDPKLLPLGVLSSHGMSVQTFRPKEKKAKKLKRKEAQ